jgi:hypothetical protein
MVLLWDTRYVLIYPTIARISHNRIHMEVVGCNTFWHLCTRVCDSVILEVSK